MKSRTWNIKYKTKQQGFTLIEVLVSVSIFAMVMVVATGSVFAIVQAKKTHTIKSVMTNLNFALESMARDIRVGSQYKCDGGGDCPTGGVAFQYKANRSVDGDINYSVSDAYDRVEYTLVGNQIKKTISAASGAQEYFVTAEEVVIEKMKFYVLGSAEFDRKQPKVVITITGYAGNGPTRSDFNIETTLSQRQIDS
jgi:prepilin-type N-terminal cleavage/methylation domain-containing protein